MRLSIRCLAVLAIALMIPALVAAQTESGKVSGTVTDQSGAVLPGVTVNLKSVERASMRSTVTNAQGEYVFASLVPGNYEVTAELSGFSTQQTQDQRPRRRDRRRQRPDGGRRADRGDHRRRRDRGRDQHLHPGHRHHGQRDPDPRAADDHPQPLRPRAALRVRRPATRSSDRGHGLRHQRRALGQHEHPARRLGEQRRVHGHASARHVPLDSVQEFSVITSNFSAQYGRASGGVVNVATKSGTNQFHGTVYEFFRNDALSTNTFDNKANEDREGQVRPPPDGLQPRRARS